MRRVLLACCLIFSVFALAQPEKRIVVVTASYNNEHYCKSMLKSIFFQEYTNWHLIYVDDGSTDKTGEIVKDLIKKYGMEEHVTYMRNETRTGRALANQYKAIYMCNDSDVIVIVDGDDRLADRHVFKYLNEVYSNEDIWLTYGQFQSYPSCSPGFCCPIPPDIVQRNAFREFTHIPSHLRTFYAGLFKKINKEDLMYDGEFFPMTGDMATMLPMIEMARHHFRFIDKVLLIYNEENPINDHKVSQSQQKSIDNIIRSRSRYEALATLFAVN